MKKKPPTVEITKDIQKSARRNYIRLERLRAKFKREYEHNCTAGPEDGCKVCAWIEDATYTELQDKIKEFEQEKEDMILDDVRGDYPNGKEYEHPTPSDGEDAQANFNNEPHGVPDLPNKPL